MKRNEIQIRDPFVLPVKEEGLYYLYGTTDKNCWSGKAVGFDVYTSKDLEEWDGPDPAFRPEKDFWAERNFWAPEVFFYGEKYYMFASFKKDEVCRGTQILVADNPKGPFLPNSEGPVTPRDWECLDGTLYIDHKGEPWIIFCHEWVQIVDGEICAMRLDKNLEKAVSEPYRLFSASEAPWSKPHKRKFDGVEKEGFVTDGPFIYETEDKELLLLWSSIGEEGYAIGMARSQIGKVLGPWIHEQEPIFKKDGGHGMVFKTLAGKLMLTIHSPNDTPNERPLFFEVVEVNGSLRLKN